MPGDLVSYRQEHLCIFGTTIIAGIVLLVIGGIHPNGVTGPLCIAGGSILTVVGVVFFIVKCICSC